MLRSYSARKEAEIIQEHYIGREGNLYITVIVVVTHAVTNYRSRR